MVFDTQALTETVCAFEARRIDDKKWVGIAIYDENQRKIQVAQYVDGDHLAYTEAMLLQVRPNTVYAHAALPGDEKKLRNICLGSGAECIFDKGNGFDAQFAVNDLPKLLIDDVRNYVKLTDEVHSMRVLGGLFKHFGLVGRNELYHRVHLTPYPMNQFARLDKATFNALNILPRPGEGVRSSTSILGLLNRTRTVIGARKLAHWITQPLVSPTTISRRHDVVELLVGNMDLVHTLQSALKFVPDLERLSTKFHKTEVGLPPSNGGASLEDLHAIYKSIKGALSLLKVLESFQGMHASTLSTDFTQPLGNCTGQFQGLVRLVESTIDLTEADKGKYLMNRSFDKGFETLAQEKDRQTAAMEQERESLERELNLGSGTVALREVDAGKGLGSGSFAFRVVKRYQAPIQNRANIRTISIKKNEYLFSTSNLDATTKKLKHAEQQYDKAQAVLVKKCLHAACSYAPVIESFSLIMGSLDVLCAFAVVSSGSQTQYVRPTISENELRIEDGVHPLVVETGRAYVPNDVYMNRESSRMQIITGPNMGGKSTYIRQVATTCLLNQIGMFVPASRAMLPVMSSIMCRVGANDVQLKGISTFMAEMIEAACILNNADERSLVIVDELGRGTSTEDGFGIAWGFGTYLANESKCFTLFATHFHELGGLEQATKDESSNITPIINKHATAFVDPSRDDKLTFLYAMKPGVADRSYGVHVARLAKFPQSAIDLAAKMATLLEEGDKTKTVTNDMTNDDRGREEGGTKKTVTNETHTNANRRKRAREEDEENDDRSASRAPLGILLHEFKCEDKKSFLRDFVVADKSMEDARMTAKRLCRVFAA